MAEGGTVCLIVEKGRLGNLAIDRFPYDGGLLQARGTDYYGQGARHNNTQSMVVCTSYERSGFYFRYIINDGNKYRFRFCEDYSRQW